jgi:hypothetical protein
MISLKNKKILVLVKVFFTALSITLTKREIKKKWNVATNLVPAKLLLHSLYINMELVFRKILNYFCINLSNPNIFSPIYFDLI